MASATRERTPAAISCVVRSVWRDNRVGIVPNSGTEEKNPPQHDITVVGNTVYGNNNAKTAAISIAQLAIGNGILVAGGNDDVVERNLVYDHDLAASGSSRCRRR